MMSDPIELDRVEQVRSFNRFYTAVVGLLRDGLLRTSYSLTEARVIFELAQRAATEVVDLRRSLDLDAGYLSRILARFETDGVVVKQRSASDGRRHVIRLTAQGRKTFKMLDRRSSEEIRTMLSALADEEQRRLIGAMGAIQEILQEPRQRISYVIRPPRPGDFGWVVHRHGVLYSEEHGWDETFEALVARIIADYVDQHDVRREAVWIAEVDGEPVGSVFCVKKNARTAQLRLLLVEPRARGMGIGTRLVQECMDFARRAGYAEMTLWTNDVLDDARRIYERAGWKLVEENEHHSFGHDLVGQNWLVSL
jgi:DNA-binding MarR family transcriptional regulator/N-acetylglutamate synthase-like GNAT family acetyltransferase